MSENYSSHFKLAKKINYSGFCCTQKIFQLIITNGAKQIHTLLCFVHTDIINCVKYHLCVTICLLPVT